MLKYWAMKPCTTCKAVLPLSNFTRRVAAKDGLNPRCKDCIRRADHRPEVIERRKSRIANSPARKPSPRSREYRRGMARIYSKTPEGKLAQRRAQLKRKYGMSLDQYNAMVASQNGVCAICYNPNRTSRPLVVDHCHTTGKVRALLCVRCNRAIGMFSDDPSMLRTAAQYLDKHSEPLDLVA